MSRKRSLVVGANNVKEIHLLGNSFEDSVTSNCSDSNSFSEDHNSLSSNEGECAASSIDDDDLSTCEQGMKKSNKFGGKDGVNQSSENCSIDDTASLTNDPSLVSSSFSSDARDPSSPSRGQRRQSHGSSSEELLNPPQHDVEDYDNNPHLESHKYRSGDALLGSQSPCSTLRHRRFDYDHHSHPQYSQTLPSSGFDVTLDEHENLDGYYCSDYDEDGLSPSAKHKPIKVAPLILKENVNGIFRRRFESAIYLFVQFAFMTCGVYYMLTVTQSGSNNVSWRMPSTRNARRLVRRIESRAFQQQQRQNDVANFPISGTSKGSIGYPNRFVIRLLGSRVDLVRRSVDQHAQCRAVSEVQIDWHSGDVQSSIRAVDEIGNQDNDFPTELLQHPSGKVIAVDPNVVYNKQQGSSDAIFLLHEGITLSCSDLERAFSEWSVDPVRVVGFFPDTFNSSSHYSLVSDDAMFIHRLYLNSRPLSQLLHDAPAIPDECHHLALSAYVYSISMHSPLVIAPSSSGNVKNGRQNQSVASFSGRRKTSIDCVPILLKAAGITNIPTTRTQFIGQSRQVVT